MVWRKRHTLLEIEFLDSLFVWGDSGALDTDRVLLDSLGSINGDLIVRLIPVRQTEVVVLEVDVQVRMNKLVLDILPYYPGHLVAIELDDGILDLDLGRARGGPGLLCV